MFRRLISALTLVCGLALWAAGSSAAWAERRVALVVGNATYKNTALALPNPRNDASDVSEALRKLDFEVVEAINVDKRGFEMALARFARAAVDADSALFFYAGHAMQYQGRNYLMPTDAELEDEISLRYQMVAIDDVRAALDRVNGVKIMILDACRNNPLAERIARQSNGFTRAVGATRGLARIDKTQGMVVAYATAAEEVAADGNGRNSPFTQALLKRLLEPGLEIEQMFRAIARDVYSNTNGRQRPETYVSLLSEYYLNQADRLAWDKVKDSTDVAALRDFIARFPSSIRALDARYRLEMLERFAREREIEKQRMEREIQARKDAEERARVAEAERLRQETERTKAEQQRVALAERARREREDAERQEREERERHAAEEKARKEA
ncbi:MAG: caspase family protein, partial [Rhizobiales bacterium]|nr:caspase family protein [Hyphomicrobiales bacterium]